jgi:hypothetical protein
VLGLAVAGLVLPVLWIFTLVLVALVLYAIELYRRSRLSKEGGGGFRGSTQGWSATTSTP